MITHVRSTIFKYFLMSCDKLESKICAPCIIESIKLVAKKR